MKILLVGGNSSLARVLKPVLGRFAEVTTAGRRDCDLEFDLGHIDPTFSIPDDIDTVINTAAAFGGSSIGDFEEITRVNVLGTLALGRLCSEAKVKHLVLVSSIFALLDPASPFHTAYSLSKRQADEWAQLQAKKSGLPLTILRPSQFYGTGSFHRRHQPFLSTMIERARRGEPIDIYGSNDALRNFIHVEDVAEVLASVVRLGLTGTYCCASLQNLRYSQIANAAINAFASTGKIRFLADKPDIPDNAFEADEAFYDAIGYRPRISIEAGMRMEAAYLEAGS